jgi:hypothetical protein
MTMVFIDYSPLYYREIAKTGPPSVIEGKFVQIRNESTEYLVLSPKSFTKYHANIVERFCLDNGLEGSYHDAGKRYILADRSWTISGGGKYAINTTQKTVRLYDESQAYGKFTAQGLRDTLLSLPEFSGFTVQVE